MTFTLGEIAEKVGGTLVGPDDLVIQSATILRDAGPGEITFADKPQLADQAETCGAAAVITKSEMAPDLPHITVEDVSAAFGIVVELFKPPSQQRVSGVSVAAHVDSTATIGRGTTVGAGCCVGENVRIGQNCTIHTGVHIMAGSQIGDGTVIFPQVTLYEDTVIGQRCILHAGVVLGAYGFGYKTVEGQHQLSAQLGNVEIHDDVEIGANTTIDRGTFGPTVVGAGTKIDDTVMIGHNCRIGRHNLLCAQVGIAGSTTTGDYVVMGGQVGIRDHVHIGDMARIGAQAGVVGNIEPGLHVVGSPAKAEKAAIQELIALSKISDVRKRLRDLERQHKKWKAWLEEQAQPETANSSNSANSANSTDPAAPADEAA